MEAQISLWFNDRIIPDAEMSESNVLNDRWSKYGYAFRQANWKEDLKTFLNKIRFTKPFDSADHCSYAFRIRSPEWVLLEWKWDDWETWAGLCILRELKRKNVEQAILLISRHFGGTYLQADRYKNVVDVSRMAIDNMKS
ncbi:MAG: Impact protein [uncultured bacterium (gcode 4)]|uniref:Impact protein n=1 Tax=uncultured bacterium (gcode 4) TaxID=1234023 RepID=K2G426_9BACT|nr:MAG: Impact protein [uncultured bacterium (gcode 4)]